jgi:hypothetical protein
MEERKGILTPEQEQLLDKLLVWKKKAGETFDGPAIQLIDNQAIERLKAKLQPEQIAVVYEIVNILFEGLAALAPAEV